MVPTTHTHPHPPVYNTMSTAVGWVGREAARARVYPPQLRRADDSPSPLEDCIQSRARFCACIASSTPQRLWAA